MKLRYFLAKTGFTMIAHQRFACCPLMRSSIRRYLYCPLLANSFILLAQKRQYGLRKIPLLTKVRRWLTSTASVPTPSTRVEHDLNLRETRILNVERGANPSRVYMPIHEQRRGGRNKAIRQNTTFRVNSDDKS